MPLLVLLLFAVSLFASSDRLFECTKIFQERKSELLVELERIDEERQALEALKAATEDLLKKKQVSLELKEEELKKQLEEIKQKEAKLKSMLEENKKILKEIKSKKMSKLALTYAKMKASAAANIIAALPDDEAIKILQELKPKAIGQILAKMPPKRASELTKLLAN